MGKNSSPLYTATIGRSDAMNSENIDIANRRTKIHSDHTPRLLAAKLWMRRWVIGETRGRAEIGGAAISAGAQTGREVANAAIIRRCFRNRAVGRPTHRRGRRRAR